MLAKYVSIDGIPQAFLSFRFVDIIVITVHIVSGNNCKSKQVADFIA
jgi:hypothetical protein